MTPDTPPKLAAGFPPDGLDRLLSDFFKNELPRPWPGPNLVSHAKPAPQARAPSDAGNRSRYTLAASVAALLGLGIYLSSGGPTAPSNRAHTGQPGIDNGKATADGKDLLPKAAHPMPGEHDPMKVPNMP